MGASRDFSGSGSARVAWNGVLPGANSAFSVCGWGEVVAGATYQALFSCGAGTKRFLGLDPSEQAYSQLNSGTQSITGSTVLSGWVFLGMSFTPSTKYTMTSNDTVQNHGAPPATNTVDAAEHWGLDGATGSFPWLGRIAHAQAWNRGITDDEMQQARWFPGSIPDGLLVYHPLWGLNTTEPDLSGNGNSGTATSTTESFSGPPVSIGLSFPVGVGLIPAAGGITGTLAKTNAADTIAATGAVLITGTMADTHAADTIAGTGTLPVDGDLAYTNLDDTLAAAGAVGSLIVGTLAYTNINDTIAAAGALPVDGDLTYTNLNDTLAATGTILVAGAMAQTNASDTLAGTGVVGNVVIGTLNVTEAVDTLAAAGLLPVQGTMADTHAADTLAGSGALPIAGTLTYQEAVDILTASGGVLISGTLAETHMNDVLYSSSAVSTTDIYYIQHPLLSHLVKPLDTDLTQLPETKKGLLH